MGKVVVAVVVPGVTWEVNPLLKGVKLTKGGGIRVSKTKKAGRLRSEEKPNDPGTMIAGGARNNDGKGTANKTRKREAAGSESVGE